MPEKRFENELERKLFELILSFRERIDVMETHFFRQGAFPASYGTRYSV